MQKKSSNDNLQTTMLLCSAFLSAILSSVPQRRPLPAHYYGNRRFKMADTRRRSVFPLLDDPSTSRWSSAGRHLTGSVGRREGSKSEGQAIKKPDRSGNKAKLPSLDCMKREQERESLRKKYKVVRICMY